VNEPLLDRDMAPILPLAEGRPVVPGTNHTSERSLPYPRTFLKERDTMPTAPVSDWGQATMTSIAAALALLLGTGPGGRETAGEIVRGWYEHRSGGYARG
jgi:hypothetical protein